ncbi:MAG: glycoside hydrolase domain-containing protein [Cypionkella sp.]
MTKIIDASVPCTAKAAALFASGIRTVIRYYSRDTVRPSKRLSPAEAAALSAAGLRIAIVHEARFGNQVTNFDRATGVADAAYARSYGAQVIGQPDGSTIYFGVDFDATKAQIKERILPYFQGVADAFAQTPGAPRYKVGIYGSGASCGAVLDAGLAEKAWLAQSTGWADYAGFKASSRWALLQGMETSVAGIDCDPNDANPAIEIGDFLLGASGAATVASAAAASAATSILAGAPMPTASAAAYVMARGGLNLRSGPGDSFDVRAVLPFGTTVSVLKPSGAWSMVDLQGDGAADGYVFSSFLAADPPQDNQPVPAAAPDVTLFPQMPGIADAVHVAELIRQGNSAEGLKAARTTATAALKAVGVTYPTNACAAHLSALLIQSGIRVPMTPGAGKLAHVLIDRGWSKIAIGKQQPGDVGVCFDNDPTPAGADHIYLVIETHGPDEMLIADNQNGAKNEPHPRYASGHGKTPTEYFLRAV